MTTMDISLKSARRIERDYLRQLRRMGDVMPAPDAADRFDVRPFASHPRRRNVRRSRPTPFGLTRSELVTASLAFVLVAAPAAVAVIYYAANR